MGIHIHPLVDQRRQMVLSFFEFLREEERCELFHRPFDSGNSIGVQLRCLGEKTKRERTSQKTHETPDNKM